MLLNLQLKEAGKCIVQQLALPINEEASYNLADTSRRELTVVVNSFPYISVPAGATFDLERLFQIEIQQYPQRFTMSPCSNFHRGTFSTMDLMTTPLTVVACSSLIDKFVHHGLLQLETVASGDTICVHPEFVGSDGYMKLPMDPCTIPTGPASQTTTISSTSKTSIIPPSQSRTRYETQGDAKQTATSNKRQKKHQIDNP